MAQPDLQGFAPFYKIAEPRLLRPKLDRSDVQLQELDRCLRGEILKGGGSLILEAIGESSLPIERPIFRTELYSIDLAGAAQNFFLPAGGDDFYLQIERISIVQYRQRGNDNVVYLRNEFNFFIKENTVVTANRVYGANNAIFEFLEVKSEAGTLFYNGNSWSTRDFNPPEPTSKKIEKITNKIVFSGFATLSEGLIVNDTIDDAQRKTLLELQRTKRDFEANRAVRNNTLSYNLLFDLGINFSSMVYTLQNRQLFKLNFVKRLTSLFSPFVSSLFFKYVYLQSITDAKQKYETETVENKYRFQQVPLTFLNKQKREFFEMESILLKEAALLGKEIFEPLQFTRESPKDTTIFFRNVDDTKKKYRDKILSTQADTSTNAKFTVNYLLKQKSTSTDLIVPYNDFQLGFTNVSPLFQNYSVPDKYNEYSFESLTVSVPDLDLFFETDELLLFPASTNSVQKLYQQTWNSIYQISTREGGQKELMTGIQSQFKTFEENIVKLLNYEVSVERPDEVLVKQQVSFLKNNIKDVFKNLRDFQLLYKQVLVGRDSFQYDIDNAVKNFLDRIGYAKISDWKISTNQKILIAKNILILATSFYNAFKDLYKGNDQQISLVNDLFKFFEQGPTNLVTLQNLLKEGKKKEVVDLLKASFTVLESESGYIGMKLKLYSNIENTIKTIPFSEYFESAPAIPFFKSVIEATKNAFYASDAQETTDNKFKNELNKINANFDALQIDLENIPKFEELDIQNFANELKTVSPESISKDNLLQHLTEFTRDSSANFAFDLPRYSILNHPMQRALFQNPKFSQPLISLTNDDARSLFGKELPRFFRTVDEFTVDENVIFNKLEKWSISTDNEIPMDVFKYFMKIICPKKAIQLA